MLGHNLAVAMGVGALVSSFMAGLCFTKADQLFDGAGWGAMALAGLAFVALSLILAAGGMV